MQKCNMHFVHILPVPTVLQRTMCIMCAVREHRLLCENIHIGNADSLHHYQRHSREYCVVYRCRLYVFFSESNSCLYVIKWNSQVCAKHKYSDYILKVVCVQILKIVDTLLTLYRYTLRISVKFTVTLI